MFTRLTSVRIKHAAPDTESAARFLCVNKNTVYIRTVQRRDGRAVLFYIELSFYPPLRCPLVSLLCVYFLSPSLAVTPHPPLRRLSLHGVICLFFFLFFFFFSSPLCQIGALWSSEIERSIRSLHLITDGR